VQQYLDAEIEHVRSRLKPDDVVLELGCGYGRVAAALTESARQVIGIDTADESLELGRTLFADKVNLELLAMDASEMSFPDSHVDVVVCVQNGICAFGVAHDKLMAEAVRVTKGNRLALFSTYPSAFWPDRLAWFEAQAASGLLGPIDREATGHGVIVCEDGFRTGALSEAELRDLCARLGLDCNILEVAGASLFCEVTKPARPD
jgi:SAM-dependent methyltransferase